MISTRPAPLRDAAPTLPRGARRMFTRWALGLAFTVFASGATAQSPIGPTFVWSQVTTSQAPTARSGHCMAYDSLRQRVILWGGEDASGLRNDTWAFQNGQWTQVMGFGAPPASAVSFMAYDEQRDRMVLVLAAALPETWEFDGVSWFLRPNAQTPPYLGPCVFNGLDVQMIGDNTPMNSYRYDGTAWQSYAATGTFVIDRVGQAAAFKSSGVMGNRTYSFGGDVQISTFPTSDDTYTLDANGQWTELTGSAQTPPARRGAAMVFEASGEADLWMFGGAHTSYFNDTWICDGEEWIQALVATAPPARTSHAMVFDEASGQAVLFGGDDGSGYLGDTWTLERAAPTPAQNVNFGASCASPPLNLSGATNPVLGGAWDFWITGSPTPLALLTGGFSNQTMSNGVPLPLDLTVAGMPGCSLLHSNELAGVIATPLSGGALRVTQPIPVTALLLGQRNYFQAFAFAPGANALQFVASDGLETTVGDQAMAGPMSLTSLPFPPGVSSLNTAKISQDGRTVFYGNSPGSRVFRWRDGSYADIGSFFGNDNLVVVDTNVDGEAAIGIVDLSQPTQEGWLWTSSAGMQSLGNARPTGISADGSVIVGWRQLPSGGSEAVLWSQATPGAWAPLTAPVSGAHFAMAMAISPNGQLVVLRTFTSGGANEELWLLDRTTGIYDLLPGPIGLPGTNFVTAWPSAVSDNGVVIGDGIVNMPNPAYPNARIGWVWSSSAGFHFLAGLNSGGPNTSSGNALDERVYLWDISADGSIICGHLRDLPSNVYKAFTYAWSANDLRVLPSSSATTGAYAYSISSDGSACAGRLYPLLPGLWRK